MTRPGEDQEIILFYYDISVYSRRIEYYLGLRGFKYSRCLQPPNLPRPDLVALGINYRRIPVLAIGRDIYIDTRVMIEKLEQLYPCNALSSKDPFQRGIEKIIEGWIIEAGPFGKTASCLPLSAPALNDPVWMEDRKQGSGGAFTRDSLVANKPAAVADLSSYFSIAEHGLLADGRKYLFNTDEPTLGDVHGVWTYDWALHMAMDGPEDTADEEVIYSSRFPKVSAWVERFRIAYAKAVKQNGKPEIVSSEEARRRILGSDFTELEGTVDLCDPLHLQKGQRIEVRPTDFGFTHADVGELVSLSARETVIAVKVKEGDGFLRLHFPRMGFKISAQEDGGMAHSIHAAWTGFVMRLLTTWRRWMQRLSGRHRGKEHEQ